MPNDFFRFKQFIIRQDRSTMKVCTDSCVLGAWTALQIKDVETVLDIGTGTGLLALMLAQKSTCTIDAIESDPDASGQAKENISLTPWSDRIRVIQEDVNGFSVPSPYDFIISNPPFFEDDLLSPESKKNRAKHNDSLTLDQLVLLINKFLKPKGHFSILLPAHRSLYFEKLANDAGFFLHKKLTLHQTPAHPPFRRIYLFGYEKQENSISESLTIKVENGNYSEAFISLMRDYYLYL
jgi:tRNA1Val (adenine37-N6)-methyltransferase